MYSGKLRFNRAALATVLLVVAAQPALVAAIFKSLQPCCPSHPPLSDTTEG